MSPISRCRHRHARTTEVQTGSLQPLPLRSQIVQEFPGLPGRSQILPALRIGRQERREVVGLRRGRHEIENRPVVRFQVAERDWPVGDIFGAGRELGSAPDVAQAATGLGIVERWLPFPCQQRFTDCGIRVIGTVGEFYMNRSLTFRLISTSKCIEIGRRP